MKQIRKSVFETNSSSTHSLTVLSKDQFEKWKVGDIFKEQYGDTFYTKEEFDKLVEEVAVEFAIETDEILENTNKYELPETYKEYCDDDYLEVDINRHETQSGEQLVIVCKYGRNG